MSRSNSYYYESLLSGAQYSVRAAALLHETLINYNPDDLQGRIEEMHRIEHAADVEKHEMMKRLVKEFITPIEREDIIELAQAIDDVTDGIEDVLLRAYMFNIKSMREESLDFCSVISSCCCAMETMLTEFHNFSKSTTIHQMIIDINRLEEDGDRLYTAAMRRLYLHSKDPVEILAWTEIFNRFEHCCDQCEDVANILESVIMKNS